MEGLARELVRQIQEARKEAGLAVSDRIQTYLGGAGPETTKAVAAHQDYIARETLSTALLLQEPPASAFRKTVLEEDIVLGIVPTRNG